MAQLPDNALTLLIDGNNLAHFLYTNLAPGQKMTPADSLRLIEHMDHYARQYHDELQIELCLDRWPGETGVLQDNLRLFWAYYPQNGDNLLIDRFWFHHISHRPCLVITNDDEILEEVSQTGGATLRVFDFVRRPGLVSPVFRDPQGLPPVPVPRPDEDESGHKLSLSTSVYFRITEDPRLHDRAQSTGTRPPIHSQPEPQKAGLGKQAAQPEHTLPSAAVINEAVTVQEDYAKETARAILSAAKNEPGSEPYYYLTIERWPLEEGIRFLTQAFCAAHHAEYQDLLELLDPAHLDVDDLRALAELLLHACEGEEGFARRGSLMNRVRLALLKARGEPVSLSELADATGLKKHGLHGRIKAKAGRWVGISARVDNEHIP